MMGTEPISDQDLFTYLTTQVPDFAEPPFADALRHWVEIKPKHGIPSRSDLDPLKMKSALSALMITKQTSENSLEVRLVGDSAATFKDGIAKGLNLYDLMADGSGQKLLQLVEQVKTQPAAIYMRYVNVYQDGTEGEDVNIGLPMTDSNASGEFTHFLTIVRSANKQFLTRHGGVMHTCVRYNELKFVDVGFGCPALPDFV